MTSGSTLVHRAKELARVAHANHLRKVGDVPYFAHLSAVARLLEAHGYDDERLIASAYLHDLLEDQPAFARQMRSEMPAEVVETVEALSEVKEDHTGRLRSKQDRFHDYVERLRRGDEAARRAIPVSCADKIDNTRSLVDAEEQGHALLLKLRTRPGEHEGHLATLREIYAPVVAPSLLDAFDEATEALLATVKAWLPGRAVMIAAEAHLGQFDKAGAPYVYHPLRLMNAARTDEERMVAVLHDVVEDSHWTLRGLRREGFPVRVVRAIDHLTEREGESYEDFIERVGEDRLASRVKLLDLEDNADLSRLSAPRDEDLARRERYERAMARLRERLEERSLQIRLDEPSVRAVRERAVHRVLRGDHVTLASRAPPSALEPAWIPGGRSVGDEVEMRAVAEHRSDRIQAWVVSIDGSSERPADGGVLHVTVSRSEQARSKESNALIADTEGETIEVELSGTIDWVEP